MIIQHTGNAALAAQAMKLVRDKLPNASTPNFKHAKAAPVNLPSAASRQAANQQAAHPQLKNAVDSINNFLQQANRRIQFSVDADTEKLVVKLIDSDTGDVIRQYPSDEVLAISKSIANMQQGLLLKQTA